MKFLPVSRKTLFLLITLLLILSLPIFIFLVQRSQENRGRANQSSVITLSVQSPAPSQQIKVNDQITLLMAVNPTNSTPGNLISVVDFSVHYDPTKLTPAAQPFTLSSNLSTSWRPVRAIQVDSLAGTISGVYALSSASGSADITKVIKSPTAFGTLSFTATNGTEGQQTVINFFNTKALSIASTDTFQENVVLTAIPAQFTIASSTLPTATPTPAPVCLAVITTAVNDTTGECKDFPNSCIPSGWHRVNSCPVVTPTASPTVKIQGHIVDANGADLSLPGAEIRIFSYDVSNPTIGTQIARLTSSPAWTSDALPRANYRVQATAPSGFRGTVTSSICNQCNFHPDYNNPSTVIVEFANNPQSSYVDIYFRFAPLVTPTVVPETTYLALNLGLHGIGYAGDNASPGRQVSFGPNNPAPSDVRSKPLHLDRSANIAFYDQNNELVFIVPITLSFSDATYSFTGKIPLSSEAEQFITPGSYSMRITLDQYLSAYIPLTTVRKDQTNTIPYLPMVTGNVYNDETNQNQLDILDYNAIMDCREDVDAANKSGTCSVPADLNDDGHVDFLDYNLFIRELSVQTGR